METRARQLSSENERLRTELRDNDRNARDVIDKYKALLDETRVPATQRGGTGAPVQAAVPSPAGELFPPAGTPRQSAPGAANAPAGTPPGARLIESFTLDGPAPGLLGDDPGTLDAKPVSLWVPAGSHAEAVVLAGVDASAGISSQGRSAPGAAAPDRPGLDRSAGRGRRHGAQRRYRGLHRDRGGPWRSLLGEGLRQAAHHDLHRAGSRRGGPPRFGGRNASRRLRRGLGQDRGCADRW